MASYYVAGGYPTLAEIRSWVKVAATTLPDAELETIAAAEQANQARLALGAGDLPSDVKAAFLRRCQRHAAAKQLPHGIIAVDAEFGGIRLSRYDAEIDRLEAAYVSPVVA